MLAPTIVVLSLILSSSAATVDVLTQGQVMNSSQTIISNGSIFELGFFSFGLGNSRTQKRFYLGIWYKQASANSNRTIVWVANRDKPIISNYSSCFLTINNDGNLAIFDRAISIPITSLPSTTNVTATLLDSGNFVLRQNRGDGTNTSSLLWQSFDYPTDTSLPGVRIEYNRKTGKTYKLTSWKSPDDPSTGHYSLLLDTERMAQFLILNGSQPLWTSGAWNGHNFRYSPDMAWTSRLYTFNYYSNGSESYFLVNNVLSNESILLTRYVIDISGKIQQFTWVESSQSWVKYWEQPKQQCNVYSYCGSNSICDKGHYPYCKCLEGFRPQNLRDWNGGNWSSGCGRRSALQCGDQDGFLIMKNMSLPLDPKVLQLQSAADCKSSCFGTCACNAYAYSNNQCLVWHGSLFNVRQADYDGEDLLLKLPAFEIKNYEELINMNSRSSNHSRFIRLSVGLALPFIASILIFGSIFHYLSKRKSKQRGRADTDLDLMLFDFTTKTKPTKRELLKPRNSTVKDEIWDVELPFFSFSSICTATNNFSNANKIGQGGFGPVYKGTLQSGHVVAVKRLSARSCQGLEELKNETTLIAKLQHRNLVKLLGCCIEGEEKILIYEYMTNKSLDLTIFDPNSQVKLSWERRTTIIEGIAQGLLYLHQYSRLRIIHRDLKTSNILLDDQLNPKISDFGMARIFEDNRTQANTNRIVGTFGYMSPEYAMKGLFSIKSDVYSFGVLMLEIISGQKNSSFYPSNESSLNLIGHAWNLWQDERELELVDQYLIFSSSSFPTSPTKYIQLALLCVQEKPSDRPTMSEVNAMLSSDSVTLPLPKQPAFCFDRGMVLSSGEKPYSINDITVSLTAR